jgi:signal transduction histidine kinase
MKKPLSVIRSLLSSSGVKNSAKKCAKMSQEIDTEVSRAAKLLDDMIALAHFETHPAEKIKIDFSQICERAAEVARRNFADHHFESRIEPRIEILATPEHLNAIVENLCENAGQHTPAGTRVFLDLKKKNKRVILSVADDGAGFDATKKEKIFEPFFAFGENRGSGLGLAVVKRAVEKLGGLLEIESNEKTGARFVVSF